MKRTLSEFASAEPFLCPAADERNLCQGPYLNGGDSDSFPQNNSSAGGIKCRQAS
jgi:hypothetical protein